MATRTEIRLYAGAPKTVCVECPQSLLVRLQHFLGSRDFDCGVARLSGLASEHNGRSKVAFEIDDSGPQDVKFAVRIFLAAGKLKFVERTDGEQTIFQLAGKDCLRPGE